MVKSPAAAQLSPQSKERPSKLESLKQPLLSEEQETASQEKDILSSYDTEAWSKFVKENSGEMAPAASDRSQQITVDIATPWS